IECCSGVRDPQFRLARAVGKHVLLDCRDRLHQAKRFNPFVGAASIVIAQSVFYMLWIPDRRSFKSLAFFARGVTDFSILINLVTPWGQQVPYKLGWWPGLGI